MCDLKDRETERESVRFVIQNIVLRSHRETFVCLDFDSSSCCFLCLSLSESHSMAYDDDEQSIYEIMSKLNENLYSLSLNFEEPTTSRRERERFQKNVHEVFLSTLFLLYI